VLFPGASCLAPASDAETQAPADSVQRDLHRRLQEADRQSYDPELTQFDTSFQDSVKALLDSLGLEAFKKSQKRARAFSLGFTPARDLWNYNRVEEIVLAAGVELRLGDTGPRIELQGGYATGSEMFRHREALRFPLAPSDWGLEAEVYYENRVLPYGANRPTLNGVRALVGGEDAQDYLEREGGGAFLHWSPHAYARFAAGYDAGEETSVPASTEFSLFGDLEESNAPVDEGIDRSAVVGLDLGSLARAQWRFAVSQCIAGGGLGGDFTYNRTRLALSARRYLHRHEFVFDSVYQRDGGDAPVQRLADIGGLTSVRGFRRRAQVGTSSFTARLEYMVPYDLLAATRLPLLRSARLQFVPWADAGRTWGGTVDAWIQAAGIGAQRYLGLPLAEASYLRFDVAFPLGPDRPEDVRLELYFAGSLF
jgi:hypothetical protein